MNRRALILGLLVLNAAMLAVNVGTGNRFMAFVSLIGVCGSLWAFHRENTAP